MLISFEAFIITRVVTIRGHTVSLLHTRRIERQASSGRTTFNQLAG